MGTVRDLIEGSLRLIGAIASGETANAAEAVNGMSSLNGMLGSWSNGGLLLPARTRLVLPLIPTQNTYSVGPTGDFDFQRPLQIDKAAIEVLSTNPASELAISLYNYQEYSGFSVKGTPSTIPNGIYYERSYPLAKINFTQIPDQANNLILYCLMPFASFSSLTDTIDMPPGFDRALKYNLACDLAPEYGKPVDPIVMNTAIESKAEIARANTEIVLMTSDTAGLSGKKIFNIMTGTF